MSTNKIDGETQLGCGPILLILFIFTLLVLLSERGNDLKKRVDAIEKALAAKEQGK